MSADYTDCADYGGRVICALFLRFETGSFLTKRKDTGEKYAFLRAK
jgi:hypothetical protein